MLLITVNQIDEQYVITEDGEWVCAHVNAYVEKACCPAGTEDCGCKGRDSIVCPNDDCTGLTNEDVEEIAAEQGAYYDYDN